MATTYPALTGSPKQTAWAADIRAGILDHPDNRVPSVTEYRAAIDRQQAGDGGDWDEPKRQAWAEAAWALAVERRALLEARAAKITAAADWIVMAQCHRHTRAALGLPYVTASVRDAVEQKMGRVQL